MKMEFQFSLGLQHDDRHPPIRILSISMREMVDSEQESGVVPKDDKRKQNKKQNAISLQINQYAVKIFVITLNTSIRYSVISALFYTTQMFWAHGIPYGVT